MGEQQLAGGQAALLPDVLSRSACGGPASQARRASAILPSPMPEPSTTPDVVEILRRWAPTGVWDVSGVRHGTYDGHGAIRAIFEETERLAEEVG